MDVVWQEQRKAIPLEQSPSNSEGKAVRGLQADGMEWGKLG